jgi:lysophospholipase L1-like esterase
MPSRGIEAGRLKHRLKHTVFSLVAIFLFFFLAESGIRVLWYVQDGNLWALMYGVPNRVLAPARGALAYLKRSGETGKKPILILAFGGSTTKGSGLATGAFSYPGILQTLLRSRFPKQTITVENHGEDGAYTKLIATWVRSTLMEKKFEIPDLVIIYSGINDARTMTLKSLPRHRPSLIQRMDGFLRNSSLLYMVAYEKWVVLMGPRRVKLVSPEPSQAPAVATDILDRYRIYLEETVRILRAFGVKGVFGTIPILAQNLPPAFVQSYRLVFREMEKLTQKIDIPLIDVAAEFSKFPDKAVMFLPEDPVHLNAEGNRRVAEILLRGMLKRGLLPLEAK